MGKPKPVIPLAIFAWLLTLHPTGAAWTCAAYGGVYIAVNIGVGRAPQAAGAHSDLNATGRAPTREADSRR